MPNMMSALKHSHIDLPRGFYAMLCHPTGSPAEEWDRAARLIDEAANMQALLIRLTHHLFVDEIRKSASGVVADANAILKRIEGR